MEYVEDGTLCSRILEKIYISYTQDPHYLHRRECLAKMLLDHGVDFCYGPHYDTKTRKKYPIWRIADNNKLMATMMEYDNR